MLGAGIVASQSAKTGNSHETHIALLSSRCAPQVKRVFGTLVAGGRPLDARSPTSICVDVCPRRNDAEEHQSKHDRRQYDGALGCHGYACREWHENIATRTADPLICVKSAAIGLVMRLLGWLARFDLTQGKGSSRQIVTLVTTCHRSQGTAPCDTTISPEPYYSTRPGAEGPGA
jgi:hypothetical protein